MDLHFTYHPIEASLAQRALGTTQGTPKFRYIVKTITCLRPLPPHQQRASRALAGGQLGSTGP